MSTKSIIKLAQKLGSLSPETEPGEIAMLRIRKKLVYQIRYGSRRIMTKEACRALRGACDVDITHALYADAVFWHK